MEIDAPGVIHRDIAVDQQAKGEHGLGHWRRAMGGFCVATTTDAAAICERVLYDLNVERPIKAVVFRAKRASLRGNYGGGRIQLFGQARLATLLHELAHHVTIMRHGFRASSHGPEFKAIFAEVFRSFGSCYGVDIVEAAQAARQDISKEVAAIQIGDIVKQIGRDRRFKVVGFRRTRISLLCLKTGRSGFSGNPLHMEVVESVTPNPIPKPTPTHVYVKANREVFSAVKAAEKAIKAAKPTPKPTPKPIIVDSKVKDLGPIKAGDLVVNTRKAGSLWKVLSVTPEGKLECRALTDDSRPGKKLPAGRVWIFAARTMARFHK